MHTLNIIHLPKRVDRYNDLVEQMHQQGIKYKLWDGEVVRKSRKTGITRSHKKIVQHAKDNNLPYVFIAEDDIVFTAKGAWQFYLSKMPPSFDIFFSMIYVGQTDKENNRIKSVCSGMTMYCVHQRFYDTFLSIPDDCHVDRTITGMFKDYEFIVCNPMVCYQSGSYSDNSLRKIDYSPLLRNANMFKGHEVSQ